MDAPPILYPRVGHQILGSSRKPPKAWDGVDISPVKILFRAFRTALRRLRRPRYPPETPDRRDSRCLLIRICPRPGFVLQAPAWISAGSRQKLGTHSGSALGRDPLAGPSESVSRTEPRLRGGKGTCTATIVSLSPFCDLLGSLRRHGWVRFKVLVRTHPWRDNVIRICSFPHRPPGRAGGPGLGLGSSASATVHSDLTEQVFGMLDADGDGVVRKEELLRGLRRMLRNLDESSNQAVEGTPRQEVELTKVETSKSEALKKALASLNIDQEQLKEIIRFAFDRFDSDGDGRIDLEEFLSAAKLLGMAMSVDEAKLVFQSLTGTGGYIAAEDVSNTHWNTWGDAVSKAMMKQYAKKGLNKFEYFVESVQEILNQDMPVQGKFQKFWALLASQQENLFDFTEVMVDLAGFSIAAIGISNELTCTGECTDSVDITNVLPFVFFLFISTRDIFKQLKVHVRASMDGPTALAYAQVFKPAGITIDDFLVRRAPLSGARSALVRLSRAPGTNVLHSSAWWSTARSRWCSRASWDSARTWPFSSPAHSSALWTSSWRRGRWKARGGGRSHLGPTRGSISSPSVTRSCSRGTPPSCSASSRATRA
ncbi:unnamed protein product [Prorocentrum cordatum]|uniref:EF-hand domain-containing protein n=1 Tax=Prorocentrum cordatum TaxID=2364126 RepID=A0ABN9QE39_9DINO|nr:unnamed protein product [Polarella glacialis]